MTQSPKRQAALKAYDRFCQNSGFARPEPEERREGNKIIFVGTAPDGREFAIGYEVEA